MGKNEQEIKPCKKKKEEKVIRWQTKTTRYGD